MTTHLYREHHTDRFSFPTHCMSVLGARLYGVKGCAHVTDQICLGESFGARVRNTMPVWFYRTADERAKAHHSLIQTKKSLNQCVVSLLCCGVVCCGVVWRVVVLWHPATHDHVHGKNTQRFSKHPYTIRLPPGNCAQKVCIVCVFFRKKQKHRNRFFAEKNCEKNP